MLRNKELLRRIKFKGEKKKNYKEDTRGRFRNRTKGKTLRKLRKDRDKRKERRERESERQKNI